MIRLVATFAVVLFVSGCGPTTLPELCNESASALCRQLYRCQPDSARAVWPNIQDCTREFENRPSCTTPEAKSCRVDPYGSSACIDAIDNIPCDGELVIPKAACDLKCL